MIQISISGNCSGDTLTMCNITSENTSCELNNNEFINYIRINEPSLNIYANLIQELFNAESNYKSLILTDQLNSLQLYDLL